MKTTKSKAVNRFIIGTFVSLYLLVSIISTIHVIDFFRLSNPEWLAISLAIGFELGAAASLAALITLEKMNKTIVWSLFILITAMQMQGNMYYAYTNIKDYQGWVELFNIVDWEPIAQKRLLAGVSGAILPLVALGFIKSLVDYIKPEDKIEEVGQPVQPSVQPEPKLEETVESMREVVESYDDLQEEMEIWERASLEDFVDEEDSIEELPKFEIDVDVINVKDEPGLINESGESRSVESTNSMQVFDSNTNTYVPTKNRYVC